MKGTGSGKGAVKRGRDTEKAKGDGKIEREMNVEKESEKGNGKHVKGKVRMELGCASKVNQRNLTDQFYKEIIILDTK